MPTLYLLDHSLTAIGGHHFDTMRLLVDATTRVGWTPVVGAHRRFRSRVGFQSNLTVCASFRRTAYSPYSATAGGAEHPIDPFAPAPITHASKSDSWLARTQASWTRWRQKRQLQTFVGACRKVFQTVAPRPGDQVFLPTLTEFDLGGVVELLRTFEPARHCRWHLQFHFPLLKGAQSTYGEQSKRLDELRTHFRTLLARIGGVKWRFYAPTQPLVDQYNELGVARFELLEHPVDVGPVNPSTPATSTDLTMRRPFRALCAGGFRIDKGTDDLALLIQDLARTDTQADVQLWVQAKRASAVERIASGLPFASLAGQSFAPDPSARIVHVPHPLPRDDYQRLLRMADAGVFAYSPDTYAARCSGVLIEMLAIGVPVLVMENTWLAQELQTIHSPPPGLIAADSSEFARSLLQLAKQRETLRAVAQSCAPAYAQLHDASRVIERILDKS